VRPSVRVPPHRPAIGGPFARPLPEGGETERFVDRPCYQFNRTLANAYDDRHCVHCRYYLTARCPHIDEFLDDVEDLAPE
jgi:hypothetical protein